MDRPADARSGSRARARQVEEEMSGSGASFCVDRVAGNRLVCVSSCGVESVVRASIHSFPRFLRMFRVRHEGPTVKGLEG